MAFPVWQQGVASPRTVIAIACMTLVGVVGCGGADANVGHVEGVVTLDGNPVPRGKVLFQPAAGRGSSAEIQADGTFQLDEPAAVGMHKIAVVAFEPGKGTGQAPTGPREPLKPIVPERYLAAGTSELTYEVKPGDNHAEFKLTTP
jgi:hypothetical protein